MSLDRYFLIRNQMTGLVLDIKDARATPGAGIVATKSNNSENQLFWTDFVTGTIRAKTTDLCLDVYGTNVVLSAYANGNPNQQWVMAGARLQNRITPAWVLGLTVPPGCAGGGAGGGGGLESPSLQMGTVTASLFTDCPGQSWTVDSPPPQFVRIRSVLTSKVLAVQSGDRTPGAAVLLAPEPLDPGDVRDKWYQNGDGIILSKINDFALNISSGRLETMPVTKDVSAPCKWVRRGRYVINRLSPDECLAVRQGAQDSAAIYVSHLRDDLHQQWRFETDSS